MKTFAVINLSFCVSNKVKSMQRLLIGAALTAMIAPINAFAVDIGGATAEDWVTSGGVAGIGVTLEAIPANEASHEYSGTGPDNNFDAVDRDSICCGASGLKGIGVDNTLIVKDDPGVTSIPSEIGYYGNTDICGTGKALGDNCADELRVVLDQAVNGGSVKASFFYAGEQNGETLRVKLYNSSVLVYSAIVDAVGNGSYDGVKPGFYTFSLDDVCWDEIRFLGDDNNVADATDYLVEEISGLDLTLCAPPEVSFTQGFFGSSKNGEALVAGLINDDNCDDINTILTSIGASEEALDCEVIESESELSHFLTGKVGPGKEKGDDNIGFLPSGFEPNDNLAAQKITVLLNMELEGGINSGNFLNIDVVDGLDPILTTGGQLGTCTDSEPDGICDGGTVVLNALGWVVTDLDAEGTTVGDVLDVADDYIETPVDVDPSDTVNINSVDLTVGQLTKILGMINESYDAGTPTGFVVFDSD